MKLGLKTEVVVTVVEVKYNYKKIKGATEHDKSTKS